MKNFRRILLAGALALASLSASAAHLSDNLHFTARMNAAQEVHAVTSDGEGVASFYLNTDMNAAGEVRGQVVDGGPCEQLKVSVETVTNPFSNVSAYPNPTNNEFHIDFVSEKNITGTIEIRDMTGRLVATQNIELSSGGNHVNIPLNNLSKGVYQVGIIIDNASTFTVKVIKL